MQKAKLRGEMVNLTDKRWANQRAYLKNPLQKNQLTCPLCASKVELHWADPPKIIPHFKHSKHLDCTYGRGESEEHNAGKIKLYNYFKTTLGDALELIEIEYFLKESKQIADIFFQFKDGQKWVVEYQRSNIPTSEIKHRRSLYQSLNINDIWICGENLVKDIGLLGVNLKNAAQDLQYVGVTNLNSIITFNPVNEEVVIYKGLEKQRNNAFFYQDAFGFPIEELCFNRWGQPFCIEDYILLDKAFRQDSRGMKVEHSVEVADIKRIQENIYVHIDKEHILCIPKELYRYIPWEMRNITFDILWKNRPSNPAEENHPLNIVGVGSNRWRHRFNQSSGIDNLAAAPATFGMLFVMLELLYNEFFMTKEERDKEIRLLLDGKQVPYYIQMNYLKKIGVLKKDVWRDQHDTPVSLEEVCLYFFRLLKIQTEDAIGTAIQLGLVHPDETSYVLNFSLVFEIKKRVKKHLETYKRKNPWIIA
ncbi:MULTISPECIES: competence protein CoiA family protein [unclassified Exiguobacterium]|uniref:competence protein CoiA n=1 Tax=unclassified Exiguobacterium TaxID=2644629 RepID=UPI001BE88237|nr:MULTISPECIES: competence protein CoiA family protein [unclassified Exiguobacterium]